MLAQMAKIHVARWQARGQTSMFCFEEYRAWLQAFCQRLLRARQLYLCRLALNGDPVSIGLYFLDGRRILGYISTFAASYADYSPGHILEAMVIDDVRARGLAEIDDFGRGGEEYKLQWAREVTVLDRFLVARKTLAGVPAFWWATQIQPFLWRNHHLGTLAREARRRMALRGRR
jgi:CelD/BcsL family acetyltransferase involved in cellulose biosynthesis